MFRKMFTLVLVGLIFLGITDCNKKENPKRVSLIKRETLEAKVLSEEKPVMIALGSIITPREGYVYYKRLLKYIGEKLGREVKLVEKETYKEINNLMKLEKLDFAFVCSGPYIIGHDEFGMELVVAQQAYDEMVFYSYIIVPVDSPTERLEELRGKEFAFVDPLSSTGKMIPIYMLAKMGETPESFFKKYIYTYAHDKSIKAVAQKLVDGAAVNSVIWKYLNNFYPEITSKTRIIKKSNPYGIKPFVTHQGMDPELKEKMKKILLNAHKDEKGKQILKGMMVDKFVVVDDSLYDSMREVKAFITNFHAHKSAQKVE